ncbi:MAG: DUF1778 domain-containing protein [Acidobacteria bacterium]|nr:DUF1778 domain-containing protein [Acidobacteriota bacterium]
MVTTKENRENRFSIRATTKQKELISRAAQRSNKTISEFVLEHAVEAAEALEMDNANFVVSREKYEQFLAALDDDEVVRAVDTVKDLRKAKSAAKAQSIAAIFEVLSNEIALEEWQLLPPDGAENHDHYLYGSPKKKK